MKDFPRKLNDVAEAIFNHGGLPTGNGSAQNMYEAFDQLIDKEDITAEEARILAGAAHLIRVHSLTSRRHRADEAYDKAFPLLEDVEQ